MSRPTTDEILSYYDIITKKITNLLQKSKLDKQSHYLYTMAINHECQHQELLVYDLQHLLADQYRPVRKNQPPKSLDIKRKSVKIDGGLYEMGYKFPTKADRCIEVVLDKEELVA